MIVLSATLALAAPPQEAVVQGLYEGVWKDAAGSLPAEVRVVALGDKKFALMARRKLADGTIDRAEIPGKIDGEQVAFAGEMGGAAWKATYAEGAIKGSIGDNGSLVIKRIERKPPSLGKKPPTGAVVLLDGQKFDEIERANKAPWHVGDMSKDGWPVWEIGLQYSGDKEPSVWPTPQNPLPAGWVIVPTRRKVETVVGMGEDGSIVVPKGGCFRPDPSTRALAPVATTCMSSSCAILRLGNEARAAATAASIFMVVKSRCSIRSAWQRTPAAAAEVFTPASIPIAWSRFSA